MKKLFLILLLIATNFVVEAQFKFPVDTLIKTGSIKRRINVVILPDGYTTADMPKFKTDANNFVAYLLSKPPFDKYKAYFSFYTVTVPSAESGVTHPGNATDEVTGTNAQPIETKNTYFGTSFDTGKIHRLVSYTKSSNLTNVLATNFPAYDIVFVIANTPYYGGAGGFAATFTTNVSANEIGVHELGHSFPGLADEYYAGAIYEREALNQSKDKSPTTNRWKNWLGTTNIGIFDHDAPGQLWAKPAKGTCRMEFLGKEFCNVCREAFVEKFLSLITPVESQVPTASSVLLTSDLTTFQLNLLKPAPNSLSVVWTLDGKVVAGQDQLQLNANNLINTSGKLVATIVDTTALSRNTTVTRKTKPTTVEWTLSRAALEPFTITANKTAICVGDSISLTTKGCASGAVITWSNGLKGISIVAKPTVNTTYSATCDAVASNSIAVTVTAVPVPTASNKGPYFEGENIELTGTGGDTYAWKGTAGFTSTIASPTIAGAKIANSGIYTLTVTKSICQATATTSVAVTAFSVKITDITPTSICPNAAITVVFSYDRKPTSDTKYTLQLSDNQGANFKNLTSTLDGTILKATIPAGTVAGSGYKIKVVSTSPTAEVIGVTALKIEAIPTASISTTTPSIFLGTEAKLTLTFTGLSPYAFALSDGNKGNASQSPFDISVKPDKTTTYTIQSVSNACGAGTVSGSVEIKVEIALSTNPLEAEQVVPYPNPTDSHINLNLSVIRKNASPVSLHFYDERGISLWQKESREAIEIMDVSALKSGVYFLKIKSGEYQSTHKIVKQ